MAGLGRDDEGVGAGNCGQMGGAEDRQVGLEVGGPVTARGDGAKQLFVSEIHVQGEGQRGSIGGETRCC